MGLSCAFEHYHEKRGLITDLELRCMYDLLHSMAHVFRKRRLACQNMFHQKLELVCDDGTHDALVLAKSEMGR
jgi:hypothetical protein